MAKRGGWKTVLKYAAGILALSASVAAAWFLPGLYANWQDAQTEGRVVLSRRESIQFLDTASLDIADRLQMLQETEDFSWDWGVALGLEKPAEEIINRCYDVMEDWCGAGLFPEGALAGIVSENLYLVNVATVHLADTTLPVYCFRFHDVDGYAVTLVTDMDVGMIYYASVSGPPMLDLIAEDLGYESLSAMGRYELKMLEEAGIDPKEFLDGNLYEDAIDFLLYMSETIRPVSASDYDFAAVCGAQGMNAERKAANLELDVELSFETFTGHAYRCLIETDYNMDPNKIGVGFAVMYGTLRWTELAEDFSGMAGAMEFAPDDALEFYDIGFRCALGDAEAMGYLDYPVQTSGIEAYDAAQGLAGSKAYDAEQGLAGSKAYDMVQSLAGSGMYDASAGLAGSGMYGAGAGLAGSGMYGAGVGLAGSEAYGAGDGLAGSSASDVGMAQEAGAGYSEAEM